MSKATIYRTDSEFKRAVDVLFDRPVDAEPIVVAKLGEGLLHFTNVLFGDCSTTNLFAEIVDREAYGIGPHFDVYEDLVEPSIPIIAVYNLAGSATVRAATLPDDLAQSYRRGFPSRTVEAYKARRNYSEIAFGMAKDKVVEHTLEPNHGLVIPQIKDNPPIVHHIVPRSPDEPGVFIKLFKANPHAKTSQIIHGHGIDTLDNLITEQLGGNANSNEDDKPATPIIVPHVDRIDVSKGAHPPRRRSVLRDGGTGLLD